MHDSITVLSLLALFVVISEWLVRHTVLRALGTALLVIVVTAIATNVGVVPPYSANVPAYDAIFVHVTPMAIFLLLLHVNLRDVLRAGSTLLTMFLIGSAATMIGVIVGMWAIGGEQQLGEHYRGLAGMFVGTYTGGSANFNAVAQATGLQKEGTLYVGAAAVDSLMTTIWMIATLAIPKWLGKRRGATDSGRTSQDNDATKRTDPIDDPDFETVSPSSVALLLAMAGLTHAASRSLEPLLGIPSILILTTVALVLAQFRFVNRIPGSRVLGIFGIYIFLAVIGSLCEVAALNELGSLGLWISLFVTIVLAVHGLVVFGIGAFFRVDPDISAIASQANVGGGTTAMALARSLGRPDLELPAILVGSCGTALGTYLGMWTTTLV